MGKQTVTVQIGPRGNAIGAHFWALQAATLLQQHGGELDRGALFHESSPSSGRTESSRRFVPRVQLIDAPGAFDIGTDVGDGDGNAYALGEYGVTAGYDDGDHYTHNNGNDYSAAAQYDTPAASPSPTPPSSSSVAWCGATAVHRRDRPSRPDPHAWRSHLRASGVRLHARSACALRGAHGGAHDMSTFGAGALPQLGSGGFGGGDELLGALFDDGLRPWVEACDSLAGLLVFADADSAFARVAAAYLPRALDDLGAGAPTLLFAAHAPQRLCSPAAEKRFGKRRRRGSSTGDGDGGAGGGAGAKMNEAESSASSSPAPEFEQRASAALREAMLSRGEALLTAALADHAVQQVALPHAPLRSVLHFDVEPETETEPEPEPDTGPDLPSSSSTRAKHKDAVVDAALAVAVDAATTPLRNPSVALPGLLSGVRRASTDLHSSLLLNLPRSRAPVLARSLLASPGTVNVSNMWNAALFARFGDADATRSAEHARVVEAISSRGFVALSPQEQQRQRQKQQEQQRQSLAHSSSPHSPLRFLSATRAPISIPASMPPVASALLPTTLRLPNAAAIVNEYPHTGLSYGAAATRQQPNAHRLVAMAALASVPPDAAAALRGLGNSLRVRAPVARAEGLADYDLAEARELLLSQAEDYLEY